MIPGNILRFFSQALFYLLIPFGQHIQTFKHFSSKVKSVHLKMSASYIILICFMSPVCMCNYEPFSLTLLRWTDIPYVVTKVFFWIFTYKYLSATWVKNFISPAYLGKYWNFFFFSNGYATNFQKTSALLPNPPRHTGVISWNSGSVQEG